MFISCRKDFPYPSNQQLCQPLTVLRLTKKHYNPWRAFKRQIYCKRKKKTRKRSQALKDQLDEQTRHPTCEKPKGDDISQREQAHKQQVTQAAWQKKINKPKSYDHPVIVGFTRYLNSHSKLWYLSPYRKIGQLIFPRSWLVMTLRNCPPPKATRSRATLIHAWIAIMALKIVGGITLPSPQALERC